MTASQTASKILSSAKLPDFARMLPSEAVFASARKSGFLKCNRTEATTVLSEIWKTTQGNSALLHQQQQAAPVANICAAHNFPPSNFTSLALLLQQTPLQTDLLAIAELLNDPPAILKSAKSKISSSRSIQLLESSQIFKKLVWLANVGKVPEAYELLAETYQAANSHKAQDYWTKAAEAGSGKACLVMGRQAVAMKKTDVAVAAFKQAMELGEAEAFYELGVLQIKQSNNSEKVESELAKEGEYNLSVAAASGIIRAAVKLAEIYKTRNDLNLSEQWVNVAYEMKAVEM
ncbi:hypothetical protein TWF481_009493 [Arthrobotrys musiformis]|uniref:Uncharacterized protein n=1 Tax=Arthrobotrys musiformis TaxID=47236 RepID=A0AAV9W4W4_9PEZI